MTEGLMKELLPASENASSLTVTFRPGDGRDFDGLATTRVVNSDGAGLIDGELTATERVVPKVGSTSGPISFPSPP